MSTYFALGLGVGTQNSQGHWLEVFYAQPVLNPSAIAVDTLMKCAGMTGGNQAKQVSAPVMSAIGDALHTAGERTLAALAQQLAGSTRPLVVTLLASDEQPGSVPEAYLKLHLLSHRLVKPHEQMLAGIFGVLPNVAWTSEGAIDLEELPARQLAARLAGRVLSVDSVDKFPKMTDYVVPKGVRVADTARVLLGAYLGEGTTVMH